MKGGKSRRAAASLMHFKSGTQNRHEAKKTKRVCVCVATTNELSTTFLHFQWLKIINVCKLSSCLSWPMKLEKISSKEQEKKTLSWTSWVMQPFSEGNKTLSATSESLLQFFPFQKEVKKAEKGGDVALWPICSPYVWLQPLSFNPSHVFIFNGI